MTMINAHKKTYEAIMPEKLRELSYELNKLGFFDAPASAGHHGNHAGGLFEHSEQVTKSLVSLTNNLGLEWQRPESPYIVGMFHDLCKCDNYQEGLDGWEYSKETLLQGHGEKSIMIAASLLVLTPEEVACIRFHMGSFTDKSEWGNYTRAIHKYPNVLYTHMADMVASHIFDI